MPDPDPPSATESVLVGLPVVFQQTPREVTAAPPSAVTLLLAVAEVVPMDEIVGSVSVAGLAAVENEVSRLYAVPAELIA